MTVDVQSSLRTYLLSALPSFTVYAGVSFPPSSYTPTDGPAIAMKVRGGRVAEENQLLIPSFQFKVYGESPLDAWTNYLSLDGALLAPADSSIQWALQEGMGTSLIEPETGWDFVLAFYQILVRNT